MRLTLLFCLLPVALTAQVADTAKSVRTIPVTDSVLRLPVDHPADLLPWMPGGGSDQDGAPTWHGFQARTLDVLTDGVRWATTFRSTGSNGLGASPIFLEPDFNALDRAELSTSGRAPASLLFHTLGGGDHWRAGVSAEGETFLRTGGGAGTTRFEGAAGGPLGGSFRIRGSGTVTGRRSAPAGLDYSVAPYFVPTGIDTTMRFPDASSLPDSIDALVQRFGATTHVPYSPLSTADWGLRLDGRLDRVGLWAHWLGTRVAERTFNYLDVANPLQARGADRSGGDLAVGVNVPFTSRTRLEGSISFQAERSEQGPLTSAAEFDSRDPALGLMLGGIDLRWDLDNFPVDDQLITNYRKNTPGSRRSPYDLENTAQYALIDQYRNNAYGILGWNEAGGPVGILAFDHDSRIVASAAISTGVGSEHSFRYGVELVHHDMQHYVHGLTSQASSDVWRERPIEGALLADWIWSGRKWRLSAGARIDRFRTGASRTYLLDTASFSPTVGRYVYFPRPSSYGSGMSGMQLQVADQAHTAFAPHIGVTGDLGDGLSFRVSAARSARMPDLSYVLQGVNTDYSISSPGFAFGTDVGHEIIDLYELGFRKDLGPVQIDASLFSDQFQKVIVPIGTGLYDPARQSNTPVTLSELLGGGSYRGLTVSGDYQATPWLQTHVAYTFSDTAAALLYPYTSGAPTFSPASNFRPHTFAFSAKVAPPLLAGQAGFGAIVSYRRMSGAARPVDPGLPPSTWPGDARVEDMPAWSSLDLRLSKDLKLGPQHLSLYLDARNLLNVANLVRAFRSGDPAAFPGHESVSWANDSAAFADEAKRNGLYDDVTGDIDLTFGGAGRGGCGAWQAASGQVAPPNCAYIIAAEERFGDGNGIYSLTEQRSASRSYYLAQFGRSAFTAPGRTIRIGAQVAF